jgi:hypothetical protein
MFSLIISSVVINEVMYDPRGPESSAGLYNEAVEIYNPTDTTVCLTSWRIKDRYDEDLIIPFPDTSILSSCPLCVLSTCIPPMGFGVILDRDYTNPSSPDPMPYSFPSGTVLMSVNDAQIGNGLSQNDTLYLINTSGDTVDIVGTFPTTGDGISAERKAPNIKVFLPSNSPYGHTLGYGNSVSCPYEFLIRLSDALDFKDSVRVFLIVKNDGTENSNFKLGIYLNGIMVDEIEDFLMAESTRSYTYTFRFSKEGTQEMGFKLDSLDCDTSNNSIFLHYTYQKPTLVINEINYKGTEWVEIYNVSEWNLNLTQLKVCDLSSCSRSIKRSLKPGEFLVITGDTNFRNLFPDVDFILVDRFPRFNDSKDGVLIKSGNFTIDSLYYTSKFGGDYNRSLERVSPYLETNEQTNWGTTQDPRGGTPGRMNSISVGGLSGGISISRKVYRVGERIIISFSLEFKAKELEVRIYDDMGRLLDRKVFKVNSNVGQVALGTDNLWRGFYFLVVEARGDKKVKAKIPFSLKPY